MKPWTFLILLAAAIALGVFAIQSYRHRFVRSNTDLVALLPPGNARFFADVAVLRRAGKLDLLAASRPAQEADYRSFMRETGFDYTRDVDTVAGALTSDRILFACRGRFDWDKLARYAIDRGGTCERSFCNVSPSAGRWVSFLQIQPDVMELEIAGHRPAGFPSSLHKGKAGEILSAPVWVQFTGKLLEPQSNLPGPLRVMAATLRAADHVTFSLNTSSTDSSSITEPFELRMDANFLSDSAAEATRNQLEIETKMLKLAFGQEHRAPNPADLTGLLASGTFQVVNHSVVGVWPVRRELLDSLR